jgi:hypothetical protein
MLGRGHRRRQRERPQAVAQDSSCAARLEHTRNEERPVPAGLPAGPGLVATVSVFLTVGCIPEPKMLAAVDRADSSRTGKER